MAKKVALIQMDVHVGDPDRNYAHAHELMLEAVNCPDGAPDILVLPETFNTGFAPSLDIVKIADEDGIRTKQFFQEFAQKHNVNIVAGSVSTVKNGKLYNTLYAFARNGEILCEYDKVHLFSPGGEDQFYEAGDHLGAFTLDGIQCGAMICYDLRFPELARSLRVQGAEIIFIVAEWPEVRSYPWTTLLKARAIENQCFICAVNGVGMLNPNNPNAGLNGGNSMVIDPMGQPIVHGADQTERILYATVDTSEVEVIREKMNNANDRKPQVYNLN